MSARVLPATDLQDSVKKNHVRETQSENGSGWRLEPHCCRACFGRVASFKTSDGVRMFMCTNCGLSEAGLKPSVVCACGLKLRKVKGDGRSSVVMVDAGIRCHENLARTPEFPALYVCSYGGAQSET